MTAAPTSAGARSPGADREELLDHVHGLFRAYLRGDRETIRRGHTADWSGFQIFSRTLVRGIEQYMQAADRVLASVKALDYELVETDVQVLGDVALVYYISRETIETAQGRKELKLRALDVYRREPDGHWNQCGSNICVLPE